MSMYDRFFAKRTTRMKRSTIREILKLTGQPDVISFAGGLPAPEFFPVERVQQATETVLAERGQEALQYSVTEGLPELRQFVAERLSADGFRVDASNVLIVSGSQQGLDLVGRVLIDEGQRVYVENPSYLGMLMAWTTYAVDYQPVPTDKDGMLVESLYRGRRQRAQINVRRAQFPESAGRHPLGGTPRQTDSARSCPGYAAH